MLPETALLPASTPDRSLPTVVERALSRVGFASAPGRPPRWQEAVGSRLFRALSPKIPRQATPAPPASLAPFEEVSIHRSTGPGTLAATWYPFATRAAGEPEN